MSHPAVGTVNTWPSLRCPEQIFTLLPVVFYVTQYPPLCSPCLNSVESQHQLCLQKWACSGVQGLWNISTPSPSKTCPSAIPLRGLSLAIFWSLHTLFRFFGLNYPQIWWVWNVNNMKVPQGFKFSPESLGASAYICIYAWDFYMWVSLEDLLLGESLTLLIYQLGECSNNHLGTPPWKLGDNPNNHLGIPPWKLGDTPNNHLGTSPWKLGGIIRLPSFLQLHCCWLRQSMLPWLPDHTSSAGLCRQSTHVLLISNPAVERLIFYPKLSRKM